MIHINSDKLKHDKPSNDRSALFPCIRSALILSRCRAAASDKQPSSSLAVIPKPFDTITVMHLDPKGTTEYEILGDGAKMIGEDDLPDASTFDRSKRNLLDHRRDKHLGQKASVQEEASTVYSTTARLIVRLASFAKSRTLLLYR